jgi:hypothetical protein
LPAPRDAAWNDGRSNDTYTVTGGRLRCRIEVPLLALALLLAGARSAAAQERTFDAKLAIEAVGGTVGSAAGLGLALIAFSPDRCPTDDIECILERLGAAGLAAAAGGSLGAWQLGRMEDTEPSLLGSVIGAIGGVAAGVGLLQLMESSGEGDPDPVVAFIGFTVTEGIVTGLFSRMFAALRDDG